MIERIDHLVLTVHSIDATVEFYERVLGFTGEISPTGRTSLKFGNQKINLHQVDKTFEPKAKTPTPGSADFCLITKLPITEITTKLNDSGVVIEVGPVLRDGALGKMTSVYFRDPDGNLVEVSWYED